MQSPAAIKEDTFAANYDDIPIEKTQYRAVTR
jgi:hypothetical protein